MKISESDWKLLRNKVIGWQELYMEKLCEEYSAILSDSNIPAAERFWALAEKIKDDKRSPGVQIEMRRSTAFFDISRFVADGIITLEALSEFSPELQEAVKLILQV